MLAIRLPADTEARLSAIAEKTGRTKSFYARAAIEEYLDDLEDFYLAEERMRDFKPGDGIPLEEIMASLDVED